MILNRDKRNNLKYLESGEVLYHTAAVGVAHTPISNKQRHFITENYDIISILLSADAKTLYLGQEQPRPFITVWDTKTGNLIRQVSKGLTTGVDNISISVDGNILAATCIDREHTLALYNIQNDYELIQILKSGPNSLILDLEWVTSRNWVLVGLNFFRYFSLGDEDIEWNDGVFKDCSNVLVCAVRGFTGDLICGSSSGEFQVWRGNQLEKQPQKLHKGPLDAIEIFRDEKDYQGQVVLTGGKDGKINILNSEYGLVYTVDINLIIPDCLDSHIKSLAISPMNRRMAIGLNSGEIYEFYYAYF